MLNERVFPPAYSLALRAAMEVAGRVKLRTTPGGVQRMILPVNEAFELPALTRQFIQEQLGAQGVENLMAFGFEDTDGRRSHCTVYLESKAADDPGFQGDDGWRISKISLIQIYTEGREEVMTRSEVFTCQELFNKGFHVRPRVSC